MKVSKEGYRIAVAGASSLLGRELLNVLEEHRFPFSSLVTLTDDQEEPELPIVDLLEGSKASVIDEKLGASELNFAFIASGPHEIASFLDPAQASDKGQTPYFVIDLRAAAAGDKAPGPHISPPQQVLSIPFLDSYFAAEDEMEEGGNRPVYISARTATIVISTLLLRLAARFPVKSAVANIFSPVSEIGSRGIEELQKQTVNLLSFHEIPSEVFGAQLAFNLLSRPGGTSEGELLGLETDLRKQIKDYLRGSVPLPALRLFQVPVFYSLAVSLFVEMDRPVAPEKAGEALQGTRVQVRRRSEHSPTPVEVAGSDEILVDSVTADLDHPTGLWIWAVADNLRLAAVNAVEIAESLGHRIVR